MGGSGVLINMFTPPLSPLHLPPTHPPTHPPTLSILI